MVGPAGPDQPTPRLVGRADRPRAAHWTPTGTSWSPPTCWAAARAAPGRRRPRRRPAVRVPVPTDHHPRPGRGRGGPARDLLGIDRWPRSSAARWAGCGPWSGRSTYPERVRRAAAAGHPAASSARPDRLGRAAAARHPGRPELARRRLLRRRPRPLAGMAVARQIAHTTYRAAAEFDEPVRPQPPGRGGPDGRAAGTRSSPTWTTTRTSSGRRFDPDTYVVLTEAMNTHDVGRGRGGVAQALRRVTARTMVAGVSSDFLYPLAQQQELADGIPRGRRSPRHRISLGPRRVPHRDRPSVGPHQRTAGAVSGSAVPPYPDHKQTGKGGTVTLGPGTAGPPCGSCPRPAAQAPRTPPPARRSRAAPCSPAIRPAGVR